MATSEDVPARAVFLRPATILLFVVAVSITLFAFVGWKAWDARDEVLARRAADARKLAHILTQHASRTIEAADLVLQGIVERLENGIDQPDQIARMNNLMAGRVRSLTQLREIVALDRDGYWRMASISPLPSYSNADRDYFAFHRDHADKGLRISEPIFARRVGRWTIALTRRVNDRSGNFAGVVLAAIDLGYFQQFYESIDVGAKGAISLYSNDGTLVLRRPFRESAIAQNFSKAEFFRDHVSVAAEGFYRATSPFDGAIKGSAFEHLPEYPLIVNVTLADEEVLAAWRATTRNDFIFAGIAASIVLLMGGLIAVQLRRRTSAEASLREREAEARAARMQAEEAAAAQGQFLATMSHELRTPLNSVLGFADILLDRSDLVPEVRRQVGLIQTAGAFLLTVVNDVLDFSKIEEGKLELVSEDFSLQAMIDNSLSVIRDFASNKRLGLTIKIEETVPRYVRGDEGRLRQVLLNLLNNAVKFTHEGTVSLAVGQRMTSGGEQVRFAVTDTGIGIAADKKDRLFQRFSQVDGSTSREFGGSGLGLAICRRLVELMGGEIGVDSVPGEGSTFWFAVTLPVAAEPRSQQRQLETARACGRPLHILLVDDVEVNQEIATAMLASAGHSVDAVSDGSDAIMAVANNAYDIVFMDIQMPGMDGVTATKHIRALTGVAGQVPIVAMTANVLPQQITSFRAAGMNGHVRKPLQRHELFASLEFASRKSESEMAAVSSKRSPVLDAGVLSEVISTLGESRTNELLAKLAGQLRNQFASSPVSHEERVALARDAHKLISTAGMFGFVSLSENCARLESAAKSEAVSIDPLLDEVRSACRGALDEIAARLDGKSPLQRTA